MAKTTLIVGRTVARAFCVAALFVCIAAPFTATAQSPDDAPVPISVAKVTRQDVPIWLRGLGTVQANYAVQLRPRVDGTLTEVPVKEGQDVKKGDLLAVIDPRPYKATLDAAVAKKQQDQAQLANAQADLARYASLVRKDFASRQQLDTQQAMVKQFTAAIAGDDAQIETAQLNLSFCYITAPFDGRVGLRNVDPGNVVHSAEATPIISVTQVEPIAVTFTLPQDTLPAITQAMAAAPAGRRRVRRRQQDRTRARRAADRRQHDRPTTGTIKLKATFANSNRALWPGQFVNARLLLGTDADVVAVAAAAVQHGPEWAVRLPARRQRHGRRCSRSRCARQEGAVYVVASGLDAGATVVTAGQSRLQAGSHVAVREAAAEPAKSGS